MIYQGKDYLIRERETMEDLLRGQVEMEAVDYAIKPESQ